MSERESDAIRIALNAMRAKDATVVTVSMALMGAGYSGPEARAAISEIAKRQ